MAVFILGSDGIHGKEFAVNALPIVYTPDLVSANQAMATKQEQVLSVYPPEELSARLARVRVGAFDFDGTLVTGSQWKVLDEFMSAELRQEAEAIRDWYFAHTRDGHSNGLSLDDEDWFHADLAAGNRLVAEAAWIAESIRLFGKAGIGMDHIEKTAQQLIAREGAIELLGLMSQRVIISFGIEQVIKSWLTFHGLRSPVAASRLTLKNGVVAGCHINLVVGETKPFAADRFRKLTGASEEELMVVGDSVVDAAMMRPGGFNVMIMPPGESDKRIVEFRENHLPAMWDRLTLILQTDSLVPLVELIRTARVST